jgi:uracil-DNA glycosylase family 4
MTDLKRALQFEAQIGTDEVVLPQGASTVVTETRVASSDVTPYASLDAFRDAICECQKCPLGATRTKFVFGVGNPEADILFVGEAPGADEDRIGEPFVGRAGKLLDKILVAIELDRSKIYIANILKCRPPGNRDPQPDEMNECFPYLEQQIEIIAPRFICALGRVAAQRLLETKMPLGKMRGQWFDKFNAQVMVTYHPAALLRFPDYKKDTWEDVQRLKAAFDASRGDA